MKNVEIFRDKSCLMRGAAEAFIDAAGEPLRSRGRFSAVLSGGETPRGVYELLAAEAFSEKIDWSRTHVFWGDERCIPPGHRDSNYGMAAKTLLSHVPIPEGNVHRIAGEENPEEAAHDYQETLHRFFAESPERGGELRARFDLVLLGLGVDGHTASLFPGTGALAEKTRWVAAQYVNALNAWRITLTAAAINDARRVLFIVSGKAKAEILRRVLQPESGAKDLPAQLIRPAGLLRWLVDEDAASLLFSRE